MDFPASHTQTLRDVSRERHNAVVDIVERPEDDRGGIGPPQVIASNVSCRMRAMDVDEAERLIGGVERDRQPFLFHFAHDEDRVGTTSHLRWGDRLFEVQSAPDDYPDRSKVRVVAVEADESLGGRL